MHRTVGWTAACVLLSNPGLFGELLELHVAGIDANISHDKSLM